MGWGFPAEGPAPGIDALRPATDDIANWLEAGWDNPSEEIVFRESQAESDPSGSPRVCEV